MLEWCFLLISRASLLAILLVIDPGLRIVIHHLIDRRKGSSDLEEDHPMIFQVPGKHKKVPVVVFFLEVKVDGE